MIDTGSAVRPVLIMAALIAAGAAASLGDTGWTVLATGVMVVATIVDIGMRIINTLNRIHDTDD